MSISIEDKIYYAIMLRGFSNNSELANNPKTAELFRHAIKNIEHGDKLSDEEKSLFLQNNFKQCWFDYAKTVAGSDNVITAAELLSDLTNPTRKGEVDDDLVCLLKNLNGDTPLAKIRDNPLDELEITRMRNLSQFMAKK